MAESLRILDVAVALRHQQDTALAELNRDEIKVRLRDRLVATAELTGETVTAEEVETAIEHYYDSQHAYQDPPMNFSVWLAHLYIRRTSVAIAAGIIVGLTLAIYWWTR